MTNHRNQCDQNDQQAQHCHTNLATGVRLVESSSCCKPAKNCHRYFSILTVESILVLTTIWLICVSFTIVTIASNNVVQAQAVQADHPVDEALPYWFSFDWFTKKYNKAYRGLESTFRRLIFVAKCLQVFKNRVQYRMGLSSYEAGINKFSDWTTVEYKAMFMKQPPPDLASEYFLKKRANQMSSQPEPATTLLEVPKSPKADSGRESPATLETARNTISEMLREAATRGADDKVEAIMSELKESEASKTMRSTAAGGKAAELRKAMLLSLGKSMSEATANEQQQLDYKSQDPFHMPVYQAPKLPEDLSSVNWSLHECFHEIYDQGKRCSQCYVMAGTAMAEFYKCAESDEWHKRKFSKNHVFNCAQNFSDRNYGCSGGSIVDVMNFIAYSGVYTVKDWKDKLSRAEKEEPDLFKYDESFARCPFDRQTVPLKDWGKIKIDITPRAVWPYQWIDYIKQGPMAVIVSMPEGSDIYEKGVHPGDGCATSQDWHSMILVGYGQENGQDFWLFRNSWGQEWGEQGHFKLSTKVAHECLHTGVRVLRKPWQPFGSGQGSAAEGEVTYMSLAEASFS